MKLQYQITAHQGRIQTHATDAFRSQFHANLIPPSQVSIKNPKNNNIYILISKCLRVGPIVESSINNFIDKNNDFKKGKFL